MKRIGIIAIGTIIVTWLALGEWQRREYVHQRNLIRDSLAGQAESIANAVISGVRSHRWIGPFFQTQLPGTLEELAADDSILAVAIVAEDTVASGDGSFADDANGYSAGDVSLLRLSDPPGGTWQSDGFHLMRHFGLRGDAPNGESMRPGGEFGPGRRPPWMDDGDIALETQFTAMLVLDRTHTDALISREAWNRGLLVLAGGLLIMLIAISWRATVRLAESQGRSRVLQVEARHLSELGQAAAGLAHETRNPLGLIRGWTQRLADLGLPTPEQQLQASAIVEECDRVTSRINEFLVFARPVNPNMAPVELRQLVDQLAILLESDLTARHLHLDLSGVPEDVLIQADEEQLRQAIFNLVQNAATFAAEDGCVTIRLVARRKGTWRLEIADDGPGPPADEVDSLFEPYFTSRADGTGLGLAIVQHIAIAHAWVAGYSPGIEGGAVFWIDNLQDVR